MAEDGDPPPPSKSKKASSWFSEKVFTCCCVGFLNPNGSGSKEYYELLGVPKSASLADIKKAYKKLSLAYHPDKLRQRGETLTEEMQEKFRKIKQAYEVLGDNDRRRTYDTLGVNGLLLKEDPSQLMNPTKLQEVLSKADKRAYCVVLSVVTLILGYLFLFPALFALEVDGTISISFAFVFLPLWIVYSLVLTMMIASVARGKNERPADLEPDQPWEDDDPLFLRQMVLGAFLLFVAFQVLIVAKLDGGFDKDAPWTLVLIPYYLFELAQLYGEKWSRDDALKAAKASDDEADAKVAAGAEDEEANPMDSLGFDERMEAEGKRREADMASHQAVYFSFRLLQVFVIALYADGVFGPNGFGDDDDDDDDGNDDEKGGGSTWWLLLIPAMVYVSVLCGRCGMGRYRSSAEAAAAERLREEPLPPEATFNDVASKQFNENLKSQRAEFHSAMSTQACFNCCCWLLYLLLFGFYMTMDSDKRFSFFYFYLPIGILVGCPLCCLCCLACLQEAGIIPEDFGEEGEGPEEQGEAGISEDEAAALEKALHESLLSGQGAAAGGASSSSSSTSEAAGSGGDQPNPLGENSDKPSSEENGGGSDGSSTVPQPAAAQEPDDSSGASPLKEAELNSAEAEGPSESEPEADIGDID